MRHFLIHLIHCLAASAAIGQVSLPSSFTTTRGTVINNARITSQGDGTIKVMHDGGIAILPHSQLPPEVRTLLGLSEANPEDMILMPEPLRAGGKTYKSPILMAIEPDGIRIQHSEGSAKVPYEGLDTALQNMLGGFNTAQAIAFRTAESERQREAQTAIAQARLTAAKESNLGISTPQSSAKPLANEANADPEIAKLQNDPNYLPPVASVRLVGRSDGGKSRDYTWKTDYGSYNRSDTSKRLIACTVSTVSRRPQRVRMQALWITRDVASKTRNITIIEDSKVSIRPGGSASIGAAGEAGNTDDKYIMLGIQEKSGTRYVGWVWRAIDGQGRVVAVTSSVPAYDAIGWQTALQ